MKATLDLFGGSTRYEKMSEKLQTFAKNQTGTRVLDSGITMRELER